MNVVGECCDTYSTYAAFFSIADIFDERLPVREGVTDGLAKAARRKMPYGGNGQMARVGGHV